MATPNSAPLSSTPVPALNANTTSGTTTVNDAVVAKIAGIAARAVPGVHDLGGGAARAIGAIRNAINNQDHSQGISVEVGETQVAADVTVIADYPMPLQQVADGVRAAIIDAIETLVGLQVTEVNVTIADVVIPSENDGVDTDSEPRVQ